MADQIGEIFNPAGPKQRFQNLLRVDSDIELLEACAALSYNQHLAVFKVSAADFKAVTKSNSSIANRLGDQWIYIDRDDKVAQGISMFVAKNTGQWHVRADNTAEPVAAEIVPYDFQAIDEEVARCEREADFWENYFLEHKLTPIRVRYEDFSEDPDATVKNVLRQLDIRRPVVSADSKVSVLTLFGWLASFFYRCACGGRKIQPKYKKLSDSEVLHKYKVRYAHDKSERANLTRK